jgi:hypothetical protein
MDIDLHRRFGTNGTITAQPSLNRIQIPPQIEAEMTPAVKAFVEPAFAKFEQRIAEPKRKPLPRTRRKQGG